MKVLVTVTVDTEMNVCEYIVHGLKLMWMHINLYLSLQIDTSLIFDMHIKKFSLKFRFICLKK